MNRRGEVAERLAATFLQDQGLKVMLRNYRCRFGEIDLIARDGKTLVFVEVRSRTTERFGGAGASITRAKRDKLLRSAKQYLAQSHSAQPCRFDAILVRGDPPVVEWIRNAFGE